MARYVANGNGILLANIDADLLWNHPSFKFTHVRMFTSTPKYARWLHHMVRDLLQLAIEETEFVWFVLGLSLHLLLLLLLCGSSIPLLFLLLDLLSNKSEVKVFKLHLALGLVEQVEEAGNEVLPDDFFLSKLGGVHLNPPVAYLFYILANLYGFTFVEEFDIVWFIS
jgi:hypothetical protein